MSHSKKKANSSSESNKVVHSYHDHANDVEEECSLQNHLVELSLYRPADQNFTARLHRLLSCAEKERISHIISWQPHGRSFLVHNKQLFEQQVVPRWFQQSCLSSFLRQLNLYGFMRLHKGPDKGGYYHELFLRGKPTLCRRIERTRIKGRGARKAVSHESEPDFYKMTPLPEDNVAEPELGRSLTTLEPGGPIIGNSSLQQEAQQSTIQQQLGWWQLQGVGNDQIVTDMPSLPNEAPLPQMSASQGNPISVETCPTNPPTSGAQSLSTGIQAPALGLSQSSFAFAMTQHPMDRLVGASTGNHHGSFAGTNPLSASLGQSTTFQITHAQASDAVQRQQTIDHQSSNSTSLRNTMLPAILAGLFEPTPFPQLPNLPPAQQRHPLQIDEQLAVSHRPLVPSQAVLALPPSPNELSGNYASAHTGPRILSNPSSEEGKEPSSLVYQTTTRQSDEAKESK